ncbi:MAG TPA: hypothetical protein VFA11_00900 [Acidimicrobiales bacterium]|nr:hypothetical protein [Acidimicrobiales bacterium]
MPSPVFVLEDDAPPVVKGVGATLKRAAAHPKLSRRLARMKGVLALKSSQDPQSVTVRFRRGTVELGRGVAKDAGVVITLDWNNMSGPHAPKPKVKGVARHPLFALGVASVLEPPLRSWREEAAAFWEFAKDWPRMPASLRVVCTDDGSEAQFGQPGEPEYEVHGSADNLKSVFSGNSILGEDYLNGKVFAVGSFEHGSVLTGRSIAWTMGDGR